MMLPPCCLSSPIPDPTLARWRVRIAAVTVGLMIPVLAVLPLLAP